MSQPEKTVIVTKGTDSVHFAADEFEVSDTGNLFVYQGDERVAVYADGGWDSVRCVRLSFCE